MDRDGNALHSTALHWLAESIWRRFVLRFYFELWYLSDSPQGMLVQGQASISAASPEDVPLWKSALGSFASGPALHWNKHRPHSQRRASRLAELLSTLRIERVCFLKRMVVHWHSIALWEIHVREMARSSRTAPFAYEPEMEPEQRRVTFLDILRDLRALYRAVAFLAYADIRALRCISCTALARTCAAQRRPNYTLIGGRPALLWRRGMELPIIICIAQPLPGDETNPRSIVDFL